MHVKEEKIKFSRTPEGLYAYKPTKRYLAEVEESKKMLPQSEHGTTFNYRGKSFLVTTLMENRKGYTQRQFEDAKRARKLYHIVGCPTVENFINILRQNIIQNCPVTPADVDLAEKIFGPDIGTLKGKTTRKAPPRVKEDLVEVPPQLKEKQQNLNFLAMVSTKQLNLLPAKGGVSPYLSPHVILGGRNWDFNKHCQIPFGAYVQAYQENAPKNTNNPRTIDAIYLRPTNNIQGGHELMDLNSGRVITRPRVWEIPVTPVVIRAVE
ncbi:MAG: hypothetical protein ACP5F1_06910, partial [Thermoplasmata archaeon]